MIDKNTAVVTISHVEYACGQRYDLNTFAKAAHDVGALFIVDATQSMGMVPINAPDTGADAIVAAGYKWLRGTYGAAVGYISPKLQSLSPGIIGFRSHKDIWNMKAERLEYPEDASRFEFTTIHFGAALGLAASIDEINAIGIQNVWKYDLKLTDSLIEGVSDLGLKIASSTDEQERSSIISIRMPSSFDTAEVVKKLQDEYGILTTNRSGFLRVSPHIDNNSKEIDFFLDALSKILNL